MSRDQPGAHVAPGRQPFSMRPARWRVPLPATGLILLITLLSLALRLLRLDFQPLWWDEGYSVWFATHPLPQMAALTAEDIHPPLYYALLHVWTLVAGAGPVAVRLVSVAAGTAAIPLAYLAGRHIAGSRRAAVLSAFLLAINPLHVYYSQEVRMYGLMVLFSLGILLAAWKIMTGSAPGRRPKRRWLVAYVLLVSAALYTQYYAVFLPLGLTLYAAWLWRRDLRRLAGWLAVQALAALLYLPWVLYAAPRLVLYVSQKVVADDDRPLGLLMYLARHLAAFVAGHLEGPLAAWWPLALVLLLPLLLLPVVSARKGRGPTAHRTAGASPLAFLGTVLATALVLGWLIGLRYPFFPERGERLLLLALPPFLLLAAIALDGLARHLRPAYLTSLALFLVTSAASLTAFYLTPRYTGEDYRPLIARTVEQGLPEDTVFCVYPWQVGYWRAYGSKSGPTAILTPSDEPDAAVQNALSEALQRGRVWFPAHLALGAILETQIEDALAHRALPFANEWYGPGTRLSAWAPLAAPPAASAVDATLVTSNGVQVALERTGVGQPVRAANEVLPVTLAWRGLAAPPLLGVSVRLVDDLGQIWAQHDYEPLGAGGANADGGWIAEDRIGVLTPAGTPPGRYHVEVAVSEDNGKRVLQVSANGESRPSVRIGDIEVLPADRTLGRERLPVAVPAETTLDNDIRFLGYSTNDSPLTPGEARRINLFWQATGTPPADYTAFVQLLDAKGAAIPVWEAPPGGAYPTSQWTPGTLMRTQATFRAPANLPDGRYGVITGLFRTGNGARAKTASGKDAIEAGTVTIKGREHNMQAPSPMFTTDVQFDSVAKLAGYSLPLWEVPPAPGETIPLTLHWQALGATDRPHTVFVHLVDEAGKVWGYGDSEPGGGALPTTGWLTGETIDDEHPVLIAPDAPSGRYRLALGLYDAASGQRLKTGDGADRVLLDEEIEVRGR